MRTILPLLFCCVIASTAWAARNVAIPECPYTGHSTCSDGKDNDLDGTVDEAAPSTPFVTSGSDYNAEAEGCVKAGSWTDTTDSAANGSHYLSNPLGQSYVGGQIACAGNFTNATYYLWALVRNPSAAKALWVSTSVITAPSNASQAAIIPTQSNFSWVAIGTTGSTANFLAKTNATAQRTFSLNGNAAFYIMSEPGIQIDCLFVSTSASAQASCPTGTPSPIPNYIALTAGAAPPTSCSDASWPQANTLNWTGFSSTTDSAPTLRLQWKSGSPSTLYGCITVPDATIVTTTTSNDDAAIFNSGDDYFEIRIAPDLTASTNGTWKIAMNAAATPAVYDASFDSIDTATTSYDAGCSKTRTTSAGVSWSIAFTCNLGFTPSADSFALFQALVGDAESGGYTYRIASGSGAFDVNDPTKWLIIKYSSTVTAAPPPDTTAPTVTSPTALNVGTVTADAQATSNEAGTGRVRYATTTGGYPSSATCAASPGTAGCSSTTNCGASTCTINLSGLTSNTTYYFRFDVTDAAGNVGTSTEANFTTATSGGKYVSSSGSGSTCSSGSPCAVSYMIANAAAGDTWRFKDGTYPPISLNCLSNFRNGTSGSPITLTADNERQAFFLGNGQQDGTIFIANCSWLNLVGLYAESADFNGSAEGNPLFIYNSSNITVTRGIFAKPNRWTNSHPMIFYIGSNFTITDNEIYFAHRSGLELAGVSHSFVARNYMHKRTWLPLSGDTGFSKSGFLCYPCSGDTIVNNIAEGWTTAGFDIQATDDTSGTKFLGNVAISNTYGWLFNARGPTSNEQPQNITLVNDVSVTNRFGFYLRSPRNVSCTNCTAIMDGSASAGILSDLDSVGERGTTPYSISGTNNLMTGGTSATGFSVAGGSGWSGTFDHNNAFGNAINFSIGGGVTSTNATTTNPNLGTCKIFIPDGTAMKGAGVSGADIGANVLYQYNSSGALTSTKLWNSSGVPQFKGATVTGLNDVVGSSLFDVQDRLNIGQNGCSTPAGY